MSKKMKHYKVHVLSELVKSEVGKLAKMGGFSVTVTGYTPKQAKFRAFLKWVKGQGLTFEEVQEHRKFWMRHPKVKVIQLKISRR